MRLQRKPQGHTENLTDVFQEYLNFEICVLSLKRLQSVKNEPNCCVPRAESAQFPRSAAWEMQQGGPS